MQQWEGQKRVVRDALDTLVAEQQPSAAALEVAAMLIYAYAIAGALEVGDVAQIVAARAKELRLII